MIYIVVFPSSRAIQRYRVETITARRRRPVVLSQPTLEDLPCKDLP